MFYLCKVVTVFGRDGAIFFRCFGCPVWGRGDPPEPLVPVQRTQEGVGQVVFSQVFSSRSFQENQGTGAGSAELLEHAVFFRRSTQVRAG